MDTQYIIFDKNISKEEQIQSLEILFNRVSEVTTIMFDKKPSPIPFNYGFPIMEENEHAVFLKECQKHNMFVDLPEHYKKKVYIAEKVKFYNHKFSEYLSDKKMSENEFEKKNPKTKLDIFYDFLFSNHMDIGILEL